MILCSAHILKTHTKLPQQFRNTTDQHFNKIFLCKDITNHYTTNKCLFFYSKFSFMIESKWQTWMGVVWSCAVQWAYWSCKSKLDLYFWIHIIIKWTFLTIIICFCFVNWHQKSGLLNFIYFLPKRFTPYVLLC